MPSIKKQPSTKTTGRRRDSGHPLERQPQKKGKKQPLSKDPVGRPGRPHAPQSAPLSLRDAQRLCDEIQFQQCELQKKNEELSRAQRESEAASRNYRELYETVPVACYTLDARGTILELNQAGATLLQSVPHHLVGRRFPLFLCESDRTLFVSFLRKTLKGDGQELCAVRLDENDAMSLALVGTRGHLNGRNKSIVRLAVMDVTGFLRVQGALQQANEALEAAVDERTNQIASTLEQLNREVVDRKQAEERLRASEETFRHVFEYAAVGIAITDLDGRFLQCNPAYCGMTGYSEEELFQHAYSTLIHSDDRDANLRQVDILTRGNVPYFIIESRYVRKSGDCVWVRKFMSLLRSEKGDPSRYIVMVTDITDRRLAEEQLQLANESLEQRVKERTTALAAANERWEWVVQATHDGVWDWNIVEDTVYLSPRWKDMHGFCDADLSESSAEWTARLHPDDCQRVLKKLEAYLAGTDLEFWEEYRIRRKDGRYLWVLDRGIAVRDEHGRAIRMVGAETDITWRKGAEEALHRREQEFRALADNVPALFSYIDRERRYRFVNKRYEELFGRSDEEIVGLRVSDLLGADGLAVVEPYLNQALEGAPVSFEYELNVPKDGVRYLSAQYVPDRDEQGRVIGLFALLADVTALKLSEAVLRERESQLRALSAQLLVVQEEERRKIARDLHDDVTQRLAALTLELHGMTQHAVDAGCDPVVVSHVKELGASVEQLTTDVQQLAHHLHPSILEHVGLEPAIREQADEFVDRTGLAVEILARDVPRRIPLDHATCLYRVLQESLQNVRKHAQASNVLVRLLGTNQGVGLCVHDDGQGFEPKQTSGGRTGLGLTSMAERVWALKGTFRVRTKRGDGTEIHAWVPLEDVKGEK